MDKHTPSKVCDKITNSFPNLNGCTVEVREWISKTNFQMNLSTWDNWLIQCTKFVRIAPKPDTLKYGIVQSNPPVPRIYGIIICIAGDKPICSLMNVLWEANIDTLNHINRNINNTDRSHLARYIHTLT